MCECEFSLSYRKYHKGSKLKEFKVEIWQEQKNKKKAKWNKLHPLYEKVVLITVSVGLYVCCVSVLPNVRTKASDDKTRDTVRRAERSVQNTNTNTNTNTITLMLNLCKIKEIHIAHRAAEESSPVASFDFESNLVHTRWCSKYGRGRKERGELRREWAAKRANEKMSNHFAHSATAAAPKMLPPFLPPFL